MTSRTPAGAAVHEQDRRRVQLASRPSGRRARRPGAGGRPRAGRPPARSGSRPGARGRAQPTRPRTVMPPDGVLVEVERRLVVAADAGPRRSHGCEPLRRRRGRVGRTRAPRRGHRRGWRRSIRPRKGASRSGPATYGGVTTAAVVHRSIVGCRDGRTPDGGAHARMVRRGRCATAYDLAMLDLDGVVYVGGEAVPGAPEHLADVRDGRDAPRVRHQQRRPAPRARWPSTCASWASRPRTSDVVTSAQAAARVLARPARRRARGSPCSAARA